jgi:hypothetical protein
MKITSVNKWSVRHGFTMNKHYKFFFSSAQRLQVSTKKKESTIILPWSYMMSSGQIKSPSLHTTRLPPSCTKETVHHITPVLSCHCQHKKPKQARGNKTTYVPLTRSGDVYVWLLLCAVWCMGRYLCVCFFVFVQCCPCPALACLWAS